MLGSIGQILCEGLKKSLASPLPWDIPWYDTGHMVFFGILYAVLGTIGLGLLIAIIKTIVSMKKSDSRH